MKTQLPGGITAIAAPPPGFADDPASFSSSSRYDPAAISSVKISVNSNVPQNEVCSSVKKIETRDDLSIILPAPSDQELYPDETQAEMETFEVELVKDQQGLGITIAGYVCEKG